MRRTTLKGIGHETDRRRIASLRPDVADERAASVLAAAYVHEDGAAVFGWIVGGVEHRHGILPGDAAGRLPVRPCHHPADAGQGADCAPSGIADGRSRGSSDRDGERLGVTGRRPAHPVADRLVGGVDRVAVRRRFDNRAAVAEMVQPYRAPLGGGSLFPLWRKQPGQPVGAHQLSESDRASARAGPAELDVERGLRSARRADRSVRLGPVARRRPERA